MKTLLNICIYSFLFSVFISCSEEGFTENGVGSIQGTVVEDGTNIPLANVKITTVPATNTTFTNDLGLFQIDNVATGDLSVQAELDEYLAEFQAANVLDGVVTNVVFELVKSNSNNRPPTAPALITPVDGATEVGFEVEFIWSASDPDGDELSYVLELRNGTTDEIEIYETGQDTTMVVNGLQLATNYFWQVSAADELNDPVSSSISEFNTITVLNTPFLLVKEENGNNVIYSGGESLEEVDVNLVPLTDSSSNSYRPRRNYTVGKIAFLRTVGGNDHLFTMNFDGTEVEQITSNIPVAGFRDDQVDYTWAQSGQKLYYPNFDKLYQIDLDAGGANLLYQTTDGSVITEVDVPEFDEDLLVLKTNNLQGYDVRIFTYRISTGVEETVVLENVQGAVSGVSIDANARTVLYAYDVSGSQNLSYRPFESRVFLFDLGTATATQVQTDVVLGENDLEPRFWPSEGGVILTRKVNSSNGIPHIFKVNFDGSNGDDQELFTQASMPDWE